MRKFFGIFFLILSVLLSVAGCILVFQKFKGYEENEEIYDTVASVAVNYNDEEETTTETEIEENKVDGAKENSKKELPGLKINEYNGEYDGPTINWEELKGNNVVAWIMLDDTVNYPVVQGKDNSYYLKHAYDGTSNANGAVFMNCNNDASFRDVNTIIYGHNLKSGKMFGTFKHYLKDTGKDMHFYIFTPDGNRKTYEIISIAETKDAGFAYTYSFSKVEEYRQYLKKIKKASAYDTKYNGDVEKKVVTLSTCRSTGSAAGWRVVIVGKEVENRKVQEPASWYKKPKDDVITILDIEKGVDKTTDEINKLKWDRKEKEKEEK